MSGHVFREVMIELGGDEYWFTPSNKFLRRVDAGLAPQTLLGVINTMDGTNVPLPAIAFVISEMVREGGGSIDEDGVLAALYDDMTNNGGKSIGPLVDVIGQCITPPGSAEKNLPAPAKSGGKKPSRQK